MSAPRVLVAFVLFLVVLVSAAPAHADDAAARAAFRKGVELYDKKRWSEALDSFTVAYREKPSAVIKQNIGLCHAKLGHGVLAATAFDEALDEGATSLNADTKAAIEGELRELEKTVATLRVRAIDDKGAKVEGVVLSLDGVELAPNAIRRPLRVEPGTHVLAARAAGYPSPPDKTLSLLAGAPVDATFELTRSPPPPPVIEQLPAAGATGTTKEGAAKETPSAYEAPDRKPPPPPKLWTIAVTLGFGGQSLRLGEGSGELPGGARRPFVGGALGARLGYKVSKLFTTELRGEVGTVGSSYAANDPRVPRETSTSVSFLALTPMLRFATPGMKRFTMGTGLGLHTINVQVDLAQQARQEKREGRSVTYSWLVDAGFQLDFGSLALEAVLFAELHGVSNARDDVVRDRMLLASPTVRYGVRLGFIVPF